MHDWGNYPGDELVCKHVETSAARMEDPYPKDSLAKAEKSKKIKAPMPNTIYFVTWCDPKKYNVGPEQEYEWFSEEKSALAKVGECHLAGYEHVALYSFVKSTWKQ